MKSVEFNENQLGDLQKIAEELFNESDDPRSYGYKRVLVRPNVSWIKIALHCAVPVLLACGLKTLLCRFGMDGILSWAVTLLLLLLYFCRNAKRAIICLIRIYQRYAPDSIRNKCRFEPSCSQYMILSLQKYGLCKGLLKGVRRLKRCNINDGGYDLP